MKLITNYHSPYALIKFGTGYKLAWIQDYDGEKSCKGYACNKPWKKICRTGVFSTYKTLRKFEPSDIIFTWRNFPSLKGVNRCIVILKIKNKNKKNKY